MKRYHAFDAALVRRASRALSTKSVVLVGCDESGRGPLAGPLIAAAVVLRPRAAGLPLRDSKATQPAERRALVAALLGRGAEDARSVAELLALTKDEGVNAIKGAEEDLKKGGISDTAEARKIRQKVPNVTVIQGVKGRAARFWAKSAISSGILGAVVVSDYAVTAAVVLDSAIIDTVGIGIANRYTLSLAAAAAWDIRRREDPAHVRPLFAIDGGEAVSALNHYASRRRGKALNVVSGDGTSASVAAASIVARALRDVMMVEYAKMHPQYGFEIHQGYPTNAHLAAIKRHGICNLHRQSFAPCRHLLTVPQIKKVASRRNTRKRERR